jgi:hypothetical protein
VIGISGLSLRTIEHTGEVPQTSRDEQESGVLHLEPHNHRIEVGARVTMFRGRDSIDVGGYKFLTSFVPVSLIPVDQRQP